MKEVASITIVGITDYPKEDGQMAAQANKFDPDYVVPPGWVLKERLEVDGILQDEFARRCGRSPKLINEIISGKAPIESRTALEFERVLGVAASIWLGIESKYQLHHARIADSEETASLVK